MVPGIFFILTSFENFWFESRPDKKKILRKKYTFNYLKYTFATKSEGKNKTTTIENSTHTSRYLDSL